MIQTTPEICDLISTVEASALTGLEQSWIRRKAAAGDIPGATRIGTSNRAMWLIPREWAENYKRDPRGRKKDTK